MLQDNLLDPDKIKANLKTRIIGREILVYKSTSSTNDIAAEYARNKDNDGMVIFADEQTAGRGRSGSQWQSAAGESILWTIILNAGHLSGDILSLVCAVAVAEAAAGLTGKKAGIKWPNDIMINSRKIAGILIESKKYGHRTAFLIGIGLNCHQTAKTFEQALAGIATSIDIEAKGRRDRISAAKVMLQSLDYWLQAAGEDADGLIHRWQNLSIQYEYSRPLTVIFNGKSFSGICRGIDPHKGLILQLETGSIAFFPAAQTRIRK